MSFILVLLFVTLSILVIAPGSVGRVPGCISFSLYGNGTRYVSGAIRNVELAEELFSDWSVYIYIELETVPLPLVEFLRSKPQVILIPSHSLSRNSFEGTFWRFLVADNTNCEVFLIRDIDSRLSL